MMKLPDPGNTQACVAYEKYVNWAAWSLAISILFVASIGVWIYMHFQTPNSAYALGGVVVLGALLLVVAAIYWLTNLDLQPFEMAGSILDIANDTRVEFHALVHAPDNRRPSREEYDAELYSFQAARNRGKRAVDEFLERFNDLYGPRSV